MQWRGVNRPIFARLISLVFLCGFAHTLKKCSSLKGFKIIFLLGIWCCNHNLTEWNTFFSILIIKLGFSKWYFFIYQRWWIDYSAGIVIACRLLAKFVCTMTWTGARMIIMASMSARKIVFVTTNVNKIKEFQGPSSTPNCLNFASVYLTQNVCSSTKKLLKSRMSLVST